VSDVDDHCDLKTVALTEEAKGRISESPEGASAAKRASTGPECFVFFSFDLVNSTNHKDVDKADWISLFRKFYDAAAHSLRSLKGTKNVSIWKYAGDEVLLYKRIRSTLELARCIPNAQDVVLDVTSQIQSRWAEYPPVSVKATVWSADISDPASVPSDDSQVQARNLAIKTLAATTSTDVASDGPAGDAQVLDFLGPDIDIGFRIAQFSESGRVVVSAETSAILLHARNKSDLNRPERRELSAIVDRLRVVAYRKLKGVWRERKYPIVWYQNDWAQFEDSVGYDLGRESLVVRSILDTKVHAERNANIEDLWKVFEDIHGQRVHTANEAERVDEIVDRLDAQTERDEKVVRAVGPQVSAIEVHCAAVVFNSRGQVLVALRPDRKNRATGRWAFGCGQLRPDEGYEACLQGAYKSKFNVDIEVLKRDGAPTPVNTYEIRESGSVVHGVVFVADALNESEISVASHEEFEWLDPADAEFQHSHDVVGDFATSISLAVSAREAHAQDSSADTESATT